MNTHIFASVFPMMSRSLEALSGSLEKAAAYAESKKTPNRTFEEALLNDRLVFDQLPLVRQVQIATDNAKNAIMRITGAEVPTFEDTETTIAQLQERIRKTIALLTSVDESALVGKEETRVSLPYWNGKSLSAYEFVTHQLIPNFYFHVATAHDIMRKNGVPIGKADYLGPLPLV